jgi:uncharacterized protein (TIGR02265 family)
MSLTNNLATKLYPTPQPSPDASSRGLQLDFDDLDVRLELATADDCAKGMFFNGALKAIATLGGSTVADQCRAASELRKYVDFFNYPISSFLKLTYTAASVLHRNVGGYGPVFHKLGQQAVQDFLATPVGKTLLLLAGKDPRRLLSTLPGAFKTAVTYGDRSSAFPAPGQCHFAMKRDFMPHPYHEGVLQTLLEGMGATNIRVAGHRTGPLDVTYHLTWE